MSLGRRGFLIAGLGPLVAGSCAFGRDPDDAVNSRLFALIDADPMATWRPTGYIDEQSQRGPYSSFIEHVPSASLVRMIRTSPSGGVEQALLASRAAGWETGKQTLERQPTDSSVSLFRLVVSSRPDGLQIYLDASPKER